MSLKLYKYEGMTIANIKVIKYKENNVYSCMCLNCGRDDVEVPTYSLSRVLCKKPKTISCMCKTSRKTRLNKAPHIDLDMKGIYYRYSGYRIRHEKRFSSDFISLEQFSELLYKNCYYCDKPPVIIIIKNSNYPYNSLSSTVDRIDSSKGYELTNCLPCCLECNVMKNNLSYSDFIQHITNIHDHIYKTDKHKYLIKEVS